MRSRLIEHILFEFRIKMSNLNKINQQQKIIMAEFMSKHNDLAKNILPNCQQGKATSIRLWQQLTDNLNSIGPPIKDVKGWRKTFADQKYQVKGKLSFNKYSKMKTGGGRFEEKVLTAADELILSAAGLDVAVEGIAVQHFGIFTPEPCIATTIRPPQTQLPSIPTSPITSTSNAAIENEPSGSTSSLGMPYFAISETERSPLTPIENAAKRTYSKKGDLKLSLLKEKIETETNFHESISNKLDKLLEIEEQNIKIQERLLAIKEKKYKAFLDLHAIELQIKTLQLESLQSHK